MTTTDLMPPGPHILADGSKGSDSKREREMAYEIFRTRLTLTRRC